MIKHTFTCTERIKSKKLISKLFEEGKSLNLYPIRVLYYAGKELPNPGHQALFVVAKKQCKSAVMRNKLKRRMREAHRLHKYLLENFQHKAHHFLIGYIYIGDPSLGNFQMIQKRITKAIAYLRGLYESMI